MKYEIEHNYGSQVHVFNNTFLSGLLAKLCSKETVQPEINRLVKMLYHHLLTDVMTREFAVEQVELETRMSTYHPDKRLSLTRIKPNQRVISVNIARAGTYPSHVCFDALHDVVDHQYLRQDHIFAARTTNGENQVTGTEIGATKIGGDKDKAIVLFPDPMGATGNTFISAVDYYKTQVKGIHSKIIALHLIITPEYLRKVLTHHPDVMIYALRLDRGLSSKAALNSIPGKLWNEEKGLNENDYIVPGGGGFGEIMNNSLI